MAKRNPKEYNKFKKDNCEVCGIHSSQMVLDVDHIKTLGSNGDNLPYNLWCLCRTCHIQKGWGLSKFAAKNPRAALILAEKGWYHDSFGGWWNDQINTSQD